MTIKSLTFNLQAFESGGRMSAITRSVLWLSFFAAILLAWAWMFMMARMMGVDWIGRPMEMMAMGDMPMMQMTSFGALFPMWAIMMAAMMLPTLVPTLRSYEDLMLSANGTRGGWLGVLLGYFVVWVGFAAVITLAQMALMASGLINDLGIANSLWFAGALFIIVGLFQFTRAKEVCHGVCHAPGMYFLGHWKTGFGGGLRMGLGLGAFCVGCCWGFMALGFVGGVMSLLWMGLATLFMVIEKLPQIGHVVTKPMGVVLILAGLGCAVYGVIV
jgi:predicted metal-binding membrane protein